MDTDTEHKTDRFTSLIIFASDHDFPAFAAKRNIDYKSVMGLYKGIIEESFVIKFTDGSALLEAGLLVGQESVLMLAPQELIYNGQRTVWLASVAKNGMVIAPEAAEYLGLWYKVSIHEALHSDAWTCDPANNMWYVAKMPELDL